MIYLDANATMPVKPSVVKIMTQALSTVGNASSVHTVGRGARKDVEEARDKLAAAIHAKSSNIIFTGCATESLNTILKSFAEDKVMVSEIEHQAGVDPVENAPRINVTSDGRIDLNDLEKKIERA